MVPYINGSKPCTPISIDRYYFLSFSYELYSRNITFRRSKILKAENQYTNISLAKKFKKITFTL